MLLLILLPKHNFFRFKPQPGPTPSNITKQVTTQLFLLKLRFCLRTTHILCVAAIASMSPPTPRSLHPLPSRLSRTHIMFNSLQSQKVIEDQFGRGGIFEGYEGRIVSRGSAAPPAPPSTGDRMSVSEGSPANWIREGPRGVSQGQWGLQPDEEEETGEQGFRSDGRMLPLLGDEALAKNGRMAMHIGNLKGVGAALRDIGSSDRGSSRGGRSARSAGSSHRWNCVDDVPLIVRDLCRLFTSVTFDMLSALYIAFVHVGPSSRVYHSYSILQLCVQRLFFQEWQPSARLRQRQRRR